jgi:hypothetical protein
MLLAIAIGGLYGRKKRVWCRHLCPIGRVLGLYSRLGAVQFTPKIRLPGGDAYSQKGACPTMIDLPRKKRKPALYRVLSLRPPAGVWQYPAGYPSSGPRDRGYS